MRHATLGIACCLLVSATGLPAQQATFKTNIELIRIDAVVVDTDGKAVHGLSEKDFALTDRKQPQSISTFEEISHPRRAAAALSPASAFPVTLKMDVASNTTVQADRLVMLVIDDLHIWQGRTDSAKELAREVVTKLGTQASMGLIFTSREGSVEVTQDRSRLMTAIDGMKARQSFRRPHLNQTPKAARVDQEDPHFMDKQFDAVNAAQRASLQDNMDNATYFETIRDATDMLRGEDQRRKAFVLISEGMAINTAIIAGGANGREVEVGSPDGVPGPDLNGDTGERMVRMMGSLRKANVSLYAIDPRGQVRPEDMMLELWPPPDCAVCNNPAVPPAASERLPSREDLLDRRHNPVFIAQDGLTETAASAGGFAITNSDDLAGGLDRILEDLDHYYLLGFYPTDTSANAKHPVALTVPGHPDYTVRFRRGFTTEPLPPGPPKNKDPLVELAAGVMPKSDLPLRLTATPLVGRGKTSSVVIALEVTAPVGLMQELDAKLRDDVTYQLMVVDEKKSKVTQREGRAAKFSMSGRGVGDVPESVTYQIPLTIDLDPGRYQLRASAMSKKLSKGGSVYLDVTVPDFSKTPLALSTISLGFVGGARVPVGRTTTRTVVIGTRPGMATPADVPLPPAQERAQNNRNPLPFEPTLSREFEHTDALRAYFEVVRGDMKSTVSLTVTILDLTNRPLLAIDKTVAPNDPGKINMRVPLETLGTGAFILRVTATNSHRVAKAETGIIVR